MAVLVDAAIWDWQGSRWAHLVSDESYDELHCFAQRLGKRRLGFQGDHYDIDEADRSRALAMGAQPVSSRTLVRHLRAAGLRRRGLRPAWQRISAAAPGVPLPGAVFASLGPAGERMAEALAGIEPLAARATSAVYLDPTRLALLIDIAPELSPPVSSLVDIPPELSPPGSDLLASLDVDERWLGTARPDGERSLELFVNR